ncbi:DinB family protein [Vibrio rhizosphaerae]|uniref:DinB family protein n=1 Tax=Vibrio rhizosphaerae TaxID=398736 RepID=A0ABU4IY44_9VIBR|nr:DinB family protein [Vibrio rhizosphaerae]MDW6094327.1 DinB family protein [Vibrio rhizosphaerae]
MNLKHDFELFAAYNQRMNIQIYQAAQQLSATEVQRDRGAFFGSIVGTLNHICVADILWLQRFATHPSCISVLRAVADLPRPTGLDQILFEDLGHLSERRIWLDQQIINWISELNDKDLVSALSYSNSKGIAANKRFSSLICHFFNHQTHHRGQVSTLLSQAGVDIGVTDLLVQIPEEI